jgi:hypothetical protein
VPEDAAGPLEQTASRYDEAASELELAARHCRVAAGRFRSGEVPRGAAHAWAARGHHLRAQELLDAQAREHAARSVPET